MTKLTKKQQELLEYIEQFIHVNNYSPTYREIMAGLGYRSVATVAKHIENLVILGKLKKSENGEARSVDLVKQTHDNDLKQQTVKYLIERAEIEKRRMNYDNYNSISRVIEILS